MNTQAVPGKLFVAFDDFRNGQTSLLIKYAEDKANISHRSGGDESAEGQAGGPRAVNYLIVCCHALPIVLY